MRRLPLVPLTLALLAATEPAFAQQGGGKSKDKPKATKGSDKDKTPTAPKDNAMTAKDPVITALDKWRQAKVSTKADGWRSALPAPPKQPFDAAREYLWHLDTSVGPLVITLLPEAAPMHVTSVIYLSRCGFYDGLEFPRVLKGFMAQGGSPTNTQSGNAGYSMDGEFLTNQKHDKPGALSAANSGEPNSDGSQFFLTFVPTPHLDGKHTVHGFVTEGLETLKQMEARGVDADGETLKEKVKIQRTWITVVSKAAAVTGDKDAPSGRGK